MSAVIEQMLKSYRVENIYDRKKCSGELTSTPSFGRIKFHLSDFQVELRIAINRIAINKHFILTHANPRFDSPWL